MWPVFLILFEWLFIMIIFFLEIFGVELNENITFLRAAGYCKAIITFVKYMPQVYLNYKRKSTEGWSIVNILFDFTGGLFSVLQDVIKAVGHGESPFSGGGFNIVKWMLGIMSIIFDIIFMAQHWLYRHNHPVADKMEQEKLIQNDLNNGSTRNSDA